MNYISKDDTIIIDPDFNEPLNDEHIAILSKYQKVIFSNFKLENSLFEAYRRIHNFNAKDYICNKFNKLVDNLPNSITHLTMEYEFNQSVDNLPNSITDLTFRNKFNQPVDNLPKNIKQIKLIKNNNYTALKKYIKVCTFIYF